MVYLEPVHHQLLRRANWLVKIRYFAALGVILGATIAKKVLVLDVNSSSLYWGAALLVFINLIYYFFIRIMRRQDKSKQIRYSYIHINVQIIIDDLILTFLLHYSGGIENPFIVFYIFHIVIGSIFLSKKNSYVLTTYAIILFFMLTFLEFNGIIAHRTLNASLSNMISENPAYLFASLIVFVMATYLVNYLSSDISHQLKVQEKRLRTANHDLNMKDQIKNEYVQRVTHDIKGHLAAIQSSLSVVDQQIVAPLDEGNAKFVKQAYDRTKKLIQFVKDLLHLTNMRLSNKFETEIFQIAETVDKALETVIINAENKNIQIVKIVEKNVSEMEGARFSIEEVISNLMLNAVKYTPEGGTVGINVSQDEVFTTFEISDTGVGIPEEEIPHIFEEFFRASNVKTVEKDGSGLGLSLVKQIVERHHGNIVVRSKLGKGTTFTVAIPNRYSSVII